MQTRAILLVATARARALIGIAMIGIAASGVVASGFATSGCARQKVLVPTGGSRADGTVSLSFEYGPGEIPKIDTEQGAIAARERCRAWGYADAEAFGGQTRQCNEWGSYGCYRWFVSLTYQCLGGNRPS